MTEFVFDYTWVNKGEWRSESSEAAAIRLACSAAFREGLDVYHQPDRIVIDRLSCPGDHGIDICDHLRVTLTKGES